MSLPNPDVMANTIHSEVQAERNRQDDKWGEQNHDDFVWGAILGEEVGEALQQALWQHFEKGAGDVRGELVQVAAVAIAWIECIDRRNGGH